MSTHRPELDLDRIFAPLRCESVDLDVRAEVIGRLRSGALSPAPRPTSLQFLVAIAVPSAAGLVAFARLASPLLDSPRDWVAAAAGCARAGLLFAGGLVESVRSMVEAIATAGFRIVAALPAPPGTVATSTATSAAVTALVSLAVITCVAAARDLRFPSPERSSSR